ncbi:uncharacterized protein LOC129769151 [Toxorhynchites rutilus septentrionalis]|uniref:uncharacterized protein LOC129769151 n=1 Tax=Toxorhynchites rutilus septentrionalis TaxID=329112 RepID=UPI002478AF7D|nr:uncharacterized protein LOC129769151 [Toxorhynchites rutilus septentrionalis]
MSKELRALTKRERQMLNSLDVVQQFLEDFEWDRDECQVEVRLQLLQEEYKEFLEVRNKIEIIMEDADSEKFAAGDEDEKEEADQLREKANFDVMRQFQNRFCVLKAQLLKLKPVSTAVSKCDRDQSNCGQQTAAFSRVKLPEISLPHFSGNIKDWVTFRDTFYSLIHNNSQLTEMDKFTYLKSSLTGEALQEVNGIELSAANYDVAWKTLESRYENRKLIVKDHLDALFSLEPLKKESYDGLNHLICEFEKNLQMLEKIGEIVSGWSTLLVHMLCLRLDTTTLRNWETHHNSKEVPTYEKLLAYLRNHCSVLQSVASAKPSNFDQRQPRVAVCHTTLKTPARCPFCTDPWHSPFQCPTFHSMSLPERNDAVSRYRLCKNCLRPGHVFKDCDRGTCHHCFQKHHSMLHVGQIKHSVPQPQSTFAMLNPPSQQPQSMQHNSLQQTHTQPQNTHTANSHSTQRSQFSTDHATTSQNYVAVPATPTPDILLSTALVRMRDNSGNSLLARALLDSCSQHCLMTRAFSKRLNFDETSAYLCVQGIGSSRNISTKAVKAAVCPRSQIISPFEEEMQFHVLPELTVPLPTTSFNPSTWTLPDVKVLADPQFYESSPVDVIIGAEHYMDLLTDGRQKVTDDGPTLQNTVFGWILSGRIPRSSSRMTQSITFVCSTVEIEQQLTRFWELETCNTTSNNSIEETICEEIFDKTTVRDSSGRFIVTLPKKEFAIERLGESKRIAINRFRGLERRFSANPELKQMYTDFIHEYLHLGHMQIVTDRSEKGTYYLPHHAVLKPESTTTKLRVVFDASCKTTTGVSLNDVLLVGPVVQDDLISLTLRFRLYQYALIADIAKMYRMIRVQPNDRHLQRILWRDSSDQPISSFELTTVTYGTASAPYLATKCLQKLADYGQQTHSLAASVIRNNFYVDDLLLSIGSIDQGRELIREIIELMESAGFSLRKWNSNSRKLLLDVPETLRDDRTILELDSSSAPIKTLGLAWEPSTDNFRFHSPKWSMAADITKRVVLSDVSRIFDPLGLVGPVVVKAKIFMQELWKYECSWDEPLTDSLQQQWQEFRRNLVDLDGMSIPRWVGVTATVKSIQLHGFCDASEKAYGACIFVRTVEDNDTVSTHLLISKSRVAPLENLKRKNRRQSIPRLELSSALLLSHLHEKVMASIHIEVKSYFWTDSMIVKCWLTSAPSRWKEFVANRVSEIQHLTSEGVWNHVMGVENPADILSRGMTPAQLQYQSSWRHGPVWLQLDESNWPQPIPIQEEELDKSIMEEKKVITVVLHAINPTANRNRRKHGFITAEERDEALKILVRLSQKEAFPQEFADLSKGEQVQESSRISSLHPQITDGIICVGGRLQHALLSTTRKHPFILHHRHPLTRAIVSYYHRKLFHAGQQLLISTVRERFWPTNARNLARKVIHECVPCFRNRPRIHDQLMADLPPERVTPCIPFQRVGVDYCGPFWIAFPHRRARPTKCFVAVYVCLVTKAVHLELVADLTTQAFLASLKRFSSRRGKPSLVMCDNATNFVGARRELDELCTLFNNQQFQRTISAEAAESNIDFRFIPARSPNFGGLWESAVKSFKTLFKRTIGTHTLLYDEMQTVLTQIEAVLNSRPLTPVSNDPNDYEALTPGHFLIQRPLTAIPEPDLDDIPVNRLSAWQRTQYFMQCLWKKWSAQYLSNLQNRTKWTKERDNLTAGTMVLLKDENLPPLKWQLGRVVELHPGSDGNIRVVTVRTREGIYRRAISKVCILPIRDNINASSEEN